MKCPNCGAELIPDIDKVCYRCPECLMNYTGQQLLNTRYSEDENE